MKPVSAMCDYTTEQVYSHKLSIYSITSHLAGVDADMDCCSIGLLSLHTLDVDDILFPVDLDYFANLLAFVVSTDNLYVNTQAGQTNPPNMLHIRYEKEPLTKLTTLPGLRHLCGWAWTSRCISGGAP